MPELVAARSTIDGASSYEELPLFFTSASHALYGVFCAPEVSSRKDRVLVFSHSLGIEHMVTQRMEVLGARAAAKVGFAAFRYDSRAHGDSTGDTKDVTFADLVDDACAAAELEARQTRYAIRLPANNDLQRNITELLKRPLGRSGYRPVVRYKSFLY